jgi:hypothetical protein
LSEGWNPIQKYWKDPSPVNRDALRAFLKPETTLWQYTHGVSDTTAVSPDGYSLDNFYLARPGADEVQLDLFGDYKSNVALYPIFQEYFRKHKPPFLHASFEACIAAFTVHAATLTCVGIIFVLWSLTG